MRANDQWVIIDTETSGLSEPVWAVEIAAQRMQGWRSDGEPFRILLNHDVDIEPGAEALHGYSREYLRKYGEDPYVAHARFREYAGDLPLVSYNLAFDWNRVLNPESARLGLPSWGNRGFCAMLLARRLLFEAPSLRLDALREFFPISQGQAHCAADDVQTIVELFRNVLKDRLHALGLVGYQSVASFTSVLPIARCVNEVQSVMDDPQVWYVLADGNQRVGPYRMRYIAALANGENWVITRKGLDRWYWCYEVEAFKDAARRNQEILNSARAKNAPRKQPELPDTPVMISQALRENVRRGNVSTPVIKTYVYELIGVLKGIMSDGILTTQEIHALLEWIQKCPCTQIYPISKIADCLEIILEDGIVTPEELEELTGVIRDALSAYE